jgi:hypothetical protein
MTGHFVWGLGRGRLGGCGVGRPLIAVSLGVDTTLFTRNSSQYPKFLNQKKEGSLKEVNACLPTSVRRRSPVR